MDIPALLKVALDAVELGSKLFVERQSDLNVSGKGVRDIVTNVDLEIERTLQEFLSRSAPTVGFMGEEYGGSIAEQGCWVLDPIDGTVNYAQGIPLCGISLAYVQDGHAQIGVIAIPSTGEIFHAVREGGAFCNGEQLNIRGEEGMQTAVIACGDFPTDPQRVADYEVAVRAQASLAQMVLRIRMFGSAAIDLVYLASGRISASITWSNRPWDVQAGVLIASEAGAIVLGADGEPHTLDSRYTIATIPNLVEPLMSVIQGARV